MPVRMKPISEIEVKLGVSPQGKAAKFLTKRCAEHMDKYVPLDEGGLAYDNREIQTNKIIYHSPYAHYMYIGEVMGPNIPIIEEGMVVGWFSPKGKKKHYTGSKIDYSKSIERGHQYAGPYWDKRMWSAEKKEILKEVQNYIKRGGN